MVQYLEIPTQKLDRSPSDITWAEDVMFVYANLGASVKQEDVSHSRYALHRWASDEKSIEKFLMTMVPKATDLLNKARQLGTGDDDSVRLERRAIAELHALLNEALTGSQDV